MRENQSRSPLKSLHSPELLNKVKMETFRKLETSDLLKSLLAGAPGSLKTRPDGTILDGHHRVTVLRERGVDVDALPREVLKKKETAETGAP